MISPELLYKEYSRKIYNLAYRMTGSRDNADDITQETFIRAFKNIDKFKGESQVYTWLYRIAKNNCLKLLRTRRKSNFPELKDLIESSSASVSEEMPEQEKSMYINQVKDGCLSGLLRCLSFHQRLAFILNILLNLHVSQVAIIMDSSENAVRILVHRAKQNLKDFLCSNCSLFDSKNKCRCENLINFSLKQKWISNDVKSTKIAENEIRDLKNVFQLYQTLGEAPAQALNSHIKQIISQKENFLILSNKKVK